MDEAIQANAGVMGGEDEDEEDKEEKPHPEPAPEQQQHHHHHYHHIMHSMEHVGWPNLGCRLVGLEGTVHGVHMMQLGTAGSRDVGAGVRGQTQEGVGGRPHRVIRSATPTNPNAMQGLMHAVQAVEGVVPTVHHHHHDEA